MGHARLASEDQPETKFAGTPIYKKGATCLQLHRAKEAIAKDDRVLLVEGSPMDAIAWRRPLPRRGGQLRTVADGPAGTGAARRHTQKYCGELSIRCAPGANAAERSSALLLEEGMQVAHGELTAASESGRVLHSAPARRRKSGSGGQGLLLLLGGTGRAARDDMRTRRQGWPWLHFDDAGGRADIDGSGAQTDRQR